MPPSVTARSTPVGVPLDDGFSTKITLAVDADISFWEKSAKAPGIDGGDKIKTSTMFNTAWHTFAPRALKELTAVTITAAYDPRVYDQIIAAINVATTITVRFPDLSTLAFYGYLRSFEPQDLEEGSQPECQITIEPTNANPSGLAETAPNYVSPAGTD